MLPSAFLFTLNTHPDPMAFLPGGNSTNSQVPFPNAYGTLPHMPSSKDEHQDISLPVHSCVGLLQKLDQQIQPAPPHHHSPLGSAHLLKVSFPQPWGSGEG